jgi:hypothetical protein
MLDSIDDALHLTMNSNDVEIYCKRVQNSDCSSTDSIFNGDIFTLEETEALKIKHFKSNVLNPLLGASSPIDKEIKIVRTSDD